MTDPTPQTSPQGLIDEQLLELATAALDYPSITYSSVGLLTDASELLAYARAAIVAAEAARPQLTPEEVEARFRSWWGECYPNVPAGRHTVRSHVAFALHLLGGEVQ